MTSEYSKKESVRFFGVDGKVTRTICIPEERLERGCGKLDVVVVIDVKQRLCRPSNDALHESGIEVEEGTDVVYRKRLVLKNQRREDVQKSIARIRLRRIGRRLSGKDLLEDGVGVDSLDEEVTGT